MKITITIPSELREKIKIYRQGVLEINISKICADAIKRELDKLDGENNGKIQKRS